MYVPAQFAETRLEVLHALMKAHPFATFVTNAGGEILVDHLPLLLDPSAGELGTLRGHVARANPLWQRLASGGDGIAVFQGPQTYISPSWYPSKHVDGKAVPTWNYVVVHASGCPRVIDDEAWLLRLVTELSDTHEAGQEVPWKVSDAPADFTERLLRAIVGIEMPITRIVGKWKVSQNRPAGDRLGVAAGLRSRADDQSLAIAELVMQHAR